MPERSNAQEPEAGRPVAPRRRVQVAARSGVDPHPATHPLTTRAAADPAPAADENDAQLLRDRPPHWG